MLSTLQCCVKYEFRKRSGHFKIVQISDKYRKYQFSEVQSSPLDGIANLLQKIIRISGISHYPKFASSIMQ